jgi:putative peptide zinc metalloprotease protein
MTPTAPAADLERRKQVRLRLRRDLVIEAQKYEGRTFFVLKDPVSLRYYRLKENEHYLLQFLNGSDTLEDAQKAYEARYRPERLKLEDLEAFAQQLLTAGLAQNESPRAGQMLFERRAKRRRSEWLQTLTNILYIKIPIFDPDRVLTWMLRYVGFVFSMWFFVLSVGLMLSAVFLVTTHFDTFRAKLPNYHEFFSFKTVVYLWGALAVVKVIHEFGHGLSCKKFGGEVHEMGALFLCFSPALYCNVSDAWTLPNKWHRIVISFAGIYVELLIAAISTFVWWNTPTQPFLHNLSLSLMVVCSVSTVVFNANPLMRYDGYYVLSDWLEIPNLRERSNRYLANLALEFCLGVEVQPEPYMALWRRVLFVLYAIVSYVYRWVVTFVILYFMYNFLRPYKLEVISTMLAAAAAGSMAGWPLYRLGKNIHRRGRLPDMKRWRVVLSGSILVGLLLFVLLVPVPISRVRGVGLVQVVPEAQSKVYVRHPGTLERLRVRDGQEVKKGDVLAEFSNRDLEVELDMARTERDNAQRQVEELLRQRENALEAAEKDRLNLERAKTEGERDKAAVKVNNLLKTKAEELILYAPRDGVVSGAPRVEEVGKYFERDPNAPFCSVIEPRRLRVCLPVETVEFNQIKENVEQDSRAARTTRRRLQGRLGVHYEGRPLGEVLDDLGRRAPGGALAIVHDEKLSEALLREPVTYRADGQRLATVLDRVLERHGLGYVVLSEPGERDGALLIREGRERGYPEGGRQQGDLAVTIRVQGRDSHTWQGRLQRLPESQAKTIPLALSNRGGGPVAVNAGGDPKNPTPQAQHFLVYIDILDPDDAISPGALAQVKVHCRPETCGRWLWRKINSLFDLGLI